MMAVELSLIKTFEINPEKNLSVTIGDGALTVGRVRQQWFVVVGYRVVSLMESGFNY